MNREAAVLGTPAATIFMGRMGAVDRWLIEQKQSRRGRECPGNLHQTPDSGGQVTRSRLRPFVDADHAEKPPSLL